MAGARAECPLPHRRTIATSKCHEIVVPLKVDLPVKLAIRGARAELRSSLLGCAERHVSFEDGAGI
jgi:hypothetical protein